MEKVESIVGIIGGSGLYDAGQLEDREEIVVDTPFGSTSSPITSGRIGTSKLLFIARHGIGHTLLPSEVNYRANIFALKSLGAQWCLSISAVGSLIEEIEPGHIVVPDQFIDRTKGRASTFFGNGIVAHIPFATPFCPSFSELLFSSAEHVVGKETVIHKAGTYLCMEGPQFSTRAESEVYRSWGASIIGMTNLPEAKLAREAEIAYATLALVTDYDCWKSRDADVDVSELLRILSQNVGFAKRIIPDISERLSAAKPSELASKALEHSILTDRSLIPEKLKTELAPLISKYL